MPTDNYTSAALLQRHRAFWRLEDTGRPLFGVYMGSYLTDVIYRVAKDNEQLLPGQMDPELFIEALIDDCQAAQNLEQDLIRPFQPISSVPWLEGMLGCPIRVQAQSVWAEPALAKGLPLESTT